MLSLKLATNNIKKGFKSFAPFLMASITMFVMIFVTASIMLSPSIKKLPGGDSVGKLMGLALVILSIFAALILVYSYRFLQLQRSREFGLYDILGFGKIRIAGVAFIELLLSYFITLVIGSVLGIAFSKFLYLVFVNLIGGDYFNLAINPMSIVIVAALFFFFFILLMLNGSWIIWRSSSLDLLREATKGEKEPKSNLFFAFLAVVLLTSGYYTAMTVQNPIGALNKFFLAVLLVIFGTYFFYVSFTVWYLKAKKKRASYYKPNNFITTSSMLYRMKANAVGLGNITILLSMTIVTVVVSLGVFFGTENMVKTNYPKEAQITSVGQKQNLQSLIDQTEKIAADSSVSISNLSGIYIVHDMEVSRQNSAVDQFVTSRTLGSMLDKDYYQVSLTTRDSLKSLGNQNLPELTNQEVLLTDLSADKKQSNSSRLKNIQWYGKDYAVKDQLITIKNYPATGSISNTLVLTFANEQALEQALATYSKAMNTNKNNNFSYLPAATVMFDINLKDEKAFTTTFNKLNNETMMLSYRTENLAQQRAQIGGFVFIGFVLGLSFILGAALIIYYKQLSEGAQDKRSFKILQEVGLSKVEVQKTIQSQVRMIFFLPLVITVLHFAGAYLMVEKMIMLFGITDNRLTLMMALVTIASIGAIYYLIYKATSRVYYKIVER